MPYISLLSSVLMVPMPSMPATASTSAGAYPGAAAIGADLRATCRCPGAELNWVDAGDTAPERVKIEVQPDIPRRLGATR